MHCCEKLSSLLWVNSLRQEFACTRSVRLSLVLFLCDACQPPTLSAQLSALSSVANFLMFAFSFFAGVKWMKEKRFFAAIESSHFSSAQVSQCGSILSSLSAFAAIAREYKSKAMQCSARLRQALCRHRIYAQCFSAFFCVLMFLSLATLSSRSLTFRLDVWLVGALSSATRMCWVARVWEISWVFNVETTITFGRERERDRRRIL